MSDDTRARRMAVRFSDEDLAWLAEHAEDEGVEPATLVRMIVSRLRKGRAPLMSMITAPKREYPQMAVGQETFRRINQSAERLSAAPDEEAYEPEGVAEDVLAARLAELEGADVVQLHGGEEAVATPIRRVARQSFNPGRN